MPSSFEESVALQCFNKVCGPVWQNAPFVSILVLYMPLCLHRVLLLVIVHPQPHLVAFLSKVSVVQEIRDCQTFSQVLNYHCDLDLEHSNPIFYKTFQLMMIHHQTKVGCKRIRSSEDS